jgi:signal-transduction protein with cAMP-binding, CBS, and nucleotidyltransferase domain
MAEALVSGTVRADLLAPHERNTMTTARLRPPEPLIGPLTVADAMHRGIGSTEPLAEAARLMADREVSHLVVNEDDRPVGVVSTLDIARAAAGGGSHER